jgi:acetyltransferase-like isoleucine patch superfamily enzyme
MSVSGSRFCVPCNWVYTAKHMNFDYYLQRLSGRATCRIGSGARLMRTARIRNIRGDSDYIAIGAHSVIRGELMTLAHGGEIRIGEWCYVGEGTRIWSAGSIEIGNRVLISHSVNVFDNLSHPLDAAARHQQIRQIFKRGHPIDISLDENPVKICDDAWIGAGAMVLRGVTVGEGGIVAAGSVVTRDVLPYSIVAGNPAEFVRKLPSNAR